MLDFSFSPLILPSTQEEVKYLLQAPTPSIKILSQAQTYEQIQAFSRKHPTVLLLPRTYQNVSIPFRILPRIHIPSLPAGKAEWLNSLKNYTRAIILPVIPWSGKAIDLEEALFLIKHTYPEFQVLVESTYLLGIEPFYMQAWQIDLTFCYLSNGNYLWASWEGENPNANAYFGFHYLPNLWNTYRTRAQKFRNFIQNISYQLKVFPVQSFGFTVFSCSKNLQENYWLAEKLRDTYDLFLPITSQEYLQISHTASHYSESIHLVEEALSKNIAKSKL